MITPPPFEAVWPDVERRLRALLFRRGLDAPSADDVVQEVALRALVGRVTYTSAKDLLRWAGPVACNLHVDLLRQRARLEGEVDDERPATNDVAGEVADRMELQRAFRGIAALRPADREAIIEAVTSEPRVARNRKEAVRLAVRRHRARSRLALVMEQLAAWFVGWRWLRQPRAAATAALLVPVAAFPLIFGTPPAPAREPAPAAPAKAVAEPATRRTPVRAVLTQRPRPRPAPKPRPAAPPATARRATEARPTQPPAVDVAAPGGVELMARGDERRDGDRLLCVYGLPVYDRVCAG